MRVDDGLVGSFRHTEVIGMEDHLAHQSDIRG